MNVSVLVGNMVKDAELKFTQSGKAVASFTVAVKRPFSKDETDFINCVVWGKNAENLGKYTQKGSKIGVTGRIQVRNYEAQDGSKRYVTEVVADSIEFLGGNPSTRNNANMDKDLTEVEINEEELPF